MLQLTQVCRSRNAYLDRLVWQAEQFPDSLAGEIVNGTAVYADNDAETVYIGTLYVPSNAAWQRFVILDYTPVTLGGDNEIPELTPEGQPVDKPWNASYERTETLDFSYTINTDKIQLETLEKVDGAGIDIAPILDGIPSDINGGSWTITPSGKQSVTTGGHTQDDSYHLNGGDASATWTVHYSVSKSVSQSGSVTANSEQDADAQASAAQSAAQSACESQVNGEIEAALSAVHGYFDNLKFSYNEINIPHGFDSTPGALGSHQTITVPANSRNDYKMQNDEWSVKVSIDKIDSETKQRIKGDAEFKIFAWDTVRQCYIPFGGYNRYKVERQSDGTYKVVNHSDYAGGSDDLFYTQRNEGKFVIVESRAPSGYYGDWSDVNAPGTACSVLGKRAYAIEITKALDGQTIWLGNADYNADITTANSGGTLIDTGEGVVTITFGSRNADKTYATDPTGIANNEDSYTMHANADKMQNDRVLGNILLTKVDLDAARYLAAGSNGDTTLEGAVYDLYAADTIEHPDGVSGVVDYSKITDANGTPIWHTTVLTNGGWDTDYLPILQKDRLVASAKITDGKLAFANLYMGRYYLVERATGLVLPIDGNGKRYTPEAIQTRILYPRSYRPYVENPPTIKHGRLHSGKKPHRKMTGLRALYYRYLYELGALPRKPSRSSYAVRQDAYKLDQRIRQMEFLSRNNIDTLTQLETHRQALQTEIRQLLTKRKQLPKTDDVQSQHESVNTALKQLRQEERLCRKIAEHSLEVQQHLTEARRDRAEQQQREQEHERDRRPNIDLTL